MNMTPEERIESNYAALQAHKAGKPVECIYLKNSSNQWEITPYPKWERDFAYRLKPEPVQRPWASPDDVPGPVCWIRLRNDSCHWMITRVAQDVIHFAGSDYAYALICCHEYSTDRKTWHPCTVEAQP